MGAEAENFETGLAHFQSLPQDALGKRVAPHRHTTRDGFGLGGWQERLRLAHAKGQLETIRYERLDALGFVFDTKAHAWNIGFMHFLAIPEDGDGHRVVVQTFVTNDGYRLGAWQHTQRQQRRSGKLDKSRMAR